MTRRRWLASSLYGCAAVLFWVNAIARISWWLSAAGAVLMILGLVVHIPIAVADLRERRERKKNLRSCGRA